MKSKEWMIDYISYHQTKWHEVCDIVQKPCVFCAKHSDLFDDICSVIVAEVTMEQVIDWTKYLGMPQGDLVPHYIRALITVFREAGIRVKEEQ